MGLTHNQILSLIEDVNVGKVKMDKKVSKVTCVMFPPPGGDSEGDSDPEEDPTGDFNRLKPKMLNNECELVQYLDDEIDDEIEKEHIDEDEEEGGSGSDSDIQNPNESDIDPQPQPPTSDNADVHGGGEDRDEIEGIDFLPATPPRNRDRDSPSPMILPPAPVSPLWQPGVLPQTPSLQTRRGSPQPTPPHGTPPSGSPQPETSGTQVAKKKGFFSDNVEDNDEDSDFIPATPSRKRVRESPPLTPRPVTPPPAVSPQPGTSRTLVAKKKGFISDSDSDSESPPLVTMSQPPLVRISQRQPSPPIFSDDDDFRMSQPPPVRMSQPPVSMSHPPISPVTFRLDEEDNDNDNRGDLPSPPHVQIYPSSPLPRKY